MDVKQHINPKELALMTIDCMAEQCEQLRSMLETDAPIDAVIKQTHAINGPLCNAVQIYVAERQGWGGKTD